MSVTVRAKLPKGDTNGLAHLEQILADRPDDVHIVVGLLRADTIEARPHDDDNPRVVKTVLLHIETVNGHAGDAAQQAMRAVYTERTGKAELPFEDGDGE